MKNDENQTDSKKNNSQKMSKLDAVMMIAIVLATILWVFVIYVKG